MRQVHGRLARLRRSTPPRRVPHRGRGPRPPAAHETSVKPTQAAGTTARAAAEFQQAQNLKGSNNPNTHAALKAICAAIGNSQVKQLTPSTIAQATQTWRDRSQHTRSNYSKAAKRFLRWCEETQGAPKAISRAVARVYQPAPRGVTATDAERESLLAAATPRLRFFLLLCGDLGIRHRTATRIALQNWQPLTRSLSFTTKGNKHMTLPVTDAIAEVITSLPADADPKVPIVNLLRPPKAEGHPPGKNPRFIKAFNNLKKKLGIRAELHIHDFRRTAAEDVWEATHDIRIVQAQLGHHSPITTVRYLANKVQLADLQPVLAKVEAMRAARRGRKDTTWQTAPPSSPTSPPSAPPNQPPPASPRQNPAGSTSPA